MTDYIYCDKVSGAQEYRFEFRHEATNFEGNISKTKTYIRPSFIRGVKNGMTYSVRVAVKLNGVWGEYGDAYNVTTSASSDVIAIQQDANPSWSRSYGVPTSDMNSAFEFVAYPNPAETQFYVKANEDAIVSIYSELGELIQTFELNADNSYEVEVKDLSTGIYFVRAMTDSEVRYEKVIVVR
jgi:hypothetical protein